MKFLFLIACAAKPAAPTCAAAPSNQAPLGTLPATADVVATGLEVPWSLAFLPNGKLLVTERGGRLRVVDQGVVANVTVRAVGEGGLLGVALHPAFASNRLFYLYFTTDADNRVERWRLADDDSSASFDRALVSGIKNAPNHDGGRLRFGPDGMLYIGTGDAARPDNAQADGLNGKLLRVSPDGGDPEIVLKGIRNTQGFDWFADGRIAVADHGPSGELNRTGHDEVTIARPGDNLGWPTIYGCEAATGLVSPLLTWHDANPPGGLAIHKGAIYLGILGATHLHRVLETGAHEVYFMGTYGRLRDVIVGPDGLLYVTTSNCDGRGDCGADKDVILRVHI